MEPKPIFINLVSFLLGQRTFPFSPPQFFIPIIIRRIANIDAIL